MAALPEGGPLRLIGTSTGALVCALYAERFPSAVDSLFLMSPVRGACVRIPACGTVALTRRARCGCAQTFNLPSCLERAAGGEPGLDAWRAAGVAQLEGVPLEWAAVGDAATHEPYPFVRCRAYVAHGNQDGFADLEDSLTWVRHASVNMRRRGMPTDAVKERRLLEVADDHALAGSMPALLKKVVEWHGLLGLQAGDLAPRVSADLESVRPQDFARGHGSNFEARRLVPACARARAALTRAPPTRLQVYRNWLISQGFDPDDMD